MKTALGVLESKNKGNVAVLTQAWENVQKQKLEATGACVLACDCCSDL